MDTSKNSVFFFDSIFEKDAQLISNKIAVLSKYIISLKQARSWPINTNFEYPKQISNNTDCGVFICQNNTMDLIVNLISHKVTYQEYEKRL